MFKLSIITVNLNNSEGLLKTIESVISQTFSNFEYIIIDGGSTDDSKKIIERYDDKITYWVSEKDNGIYNGMNKGIEVAKGEYCLFLNSGDWLLSNNILEEVFINDYNVDFIYGNIKTEKDIIKYSGKLTLVTFFFGSIPHPATFIKKILFNLYGLYNEENKIVSDWEFFLKTIIINQSTYKYVDQTISYFASNGISSDIKMNNIQKKERKIVLQKYFPIVYDVFDEMYRLKELEYKLNFYEKSRIIQLIKRLQQSKFYEKLRGKRRKLKVEN